MKIKIFGVEIEISFLFTVAVAVVASGDASGLFVKFLAAAAIHEAAHLVVMLFLNTPPKKIRLILGGINIIEGEGQDPISSIAILLAGPLSNLFCFLVLRGEFSLINLLLFIYNSLPVTGLDGGRICEIILSFWYSDKVVGRIVFFLSLLVSLGFASAFVILYFSGVTNFTVIIMSLYILATLFLKKCVERKA